MDTTKTVYQVAPADVQKVCTLLLDNWSICFTILKTSPYCRDHFYEIRACSQVVSQDNTKRNVSLTVPIVTQLGFFLSVPMSLCHFRGFNKVILIDLGQDMTKGTLWLC